MLIEKAEYDKLLKTVHEFTDHLDADGYRFLTDHDTLVFFADKVMEDFPQLKGVWIDEVITVIGAIFAFVAASRTEETVHLPKLGDFSSFDELIDYINEKITSDR